MGTCRDCRFYMSADDAQERCDYESQTLGEGYGICVRYPPTFHVLPESYAAQWDTSYPEVWEAWICGEFQHKAT